MPACLQVWIMKQVYGLIFGNLARALRRSNLHGATAVGGRYCLVRGRGDWDLNCVAPVVWARP